MDCRRLRYLLMAETVRPASAAPATGSGARGSAPADEAARHLSECPACSRFARRLELARTALGRDRLQEPAGLADYAGVTAGMPRLALEPDGAFADRVVLRLARPADVLGWAAFRALPAAVGLALALAILGLTTSAPPVSLLADVPSTDQLLTWSSLAPDEAP
jgi:hypothetical protein